MRNTPARSLAYWWEQTTLCSAAWRAKVSREHGVLEGEKSKLCGPLRRRQGDTAYGYTHACLPASPHWLFWLHVSMPSTSMSERTRGCILVRHDRASAGFEKAHASADATRTRQHGCQRVLPSTRQMAGRALERRAWETKGNYYGPCLR
jgi:hypothetical protein